MVHNSHDVVLVPPFWIQDTFDLTSHDNDLTCRNELSTSVRRSEMVRHASRRDVSIESLRQPADHLGSLARRERGGRTGRKDKVTVEIDDKSIIGRGKERATFSSHSHNIRTRLLNEFFDVASMYDWFVETTPFVDANEITDGFGCDGEHGWVVADKDDASSR